MVLGPRETSIQTHGVTVQRQICFIKPAIYLYCSSTVRKTLNYEHNSARQARSVEGAFAMKTPYHHNIVIAGHPYLHSASTVCSLSWNFISSWIFILQSRYSIIFNKLVMPLITYAHRPTLKFANIINRHAIVRIFCPTLCDVYQLCDYTFCKQSLIHKKKKT